MLETILVDKEETNQLSNRTLLQVDRITLDISLSRLLHAFFAQADNYEQVDWSDAIVTGGFVMLRFVIRFEKNSHVTRSATNMIHFWLVSFSLLFAGTRGNHDLRGCQDIDPRCSLVQEVMNDSVR